MKVETKLIVSMYKVVLLLVLLKGLMVKLVYLEKSVVTSLQQKDLVYMVKLEY